MSSTWGVSFGTSWASSWDIVSRADTGARSIGGNKGKIDPRIWPQRYPTKKKELVALAKEIYTEARNVIPEKEQEALIPIEAVRDEQQAKTAVTLPKPSGIDFKILAEDEAILRAMVAEIEAQREIEKRKAMQAKIDRRRKSEEAFIMQLMKNYSLTEVD